MRESESVFSSCKEKQKEIKLMTRDVGYAAPGRLWQTCRGQREKKSERESRERQEKEQLSRKKHKRAKNGRGKREKKTVKEQTERKSLLLCFFFVRVVLSLVSHLCSL